MLCSSEPEGAVSERAVNPAQRSFAREVLAAVPWFVHCRAETLDRFVAEGRIRDYQRGEYVLRQGEQTPALGVILRGMIEMSTTAPSGRRHVLTHLSAGQVFNLVPMLDQQGSVFDVRAHEPSTTLYVPEAIFKAAVEQEPELARDLVRLLSFQSRDLAGYISDEMLMPLPARCARILLLMVQYHGVPRKDGSFLIDLKLSQEEFAEMIGRSRQSVNQELQKLEDAGLIETAYSRFVVRDPAALKAIAENY